MDEDFRPPDEPPGQVLRARAPTARTRSTYGSAVRGELGMLRNVFHVSAFDMLIKGLLFALYVIQFAMHVAYAVPLVTDASVVTPVFYFIAAYVLAATAAVVALVSLLDAYDVGLHLSGLDAAGRPAVTSYRDRTFNLMCALMAVGANLLVGIYWTLWYAGNTNIDTAGALAADPYVAGQYFGLAGASLVLYFVSPAFLAAASYASTRYAFSVALVDHVAQRMGKGGLRQLLSPDDGQV